MDTPPKPRRTVADVDALIDENGSRIDLPEDTPIRAAGSHDATVGATGPTNWWFYGLVTLAVIIAAVFLMQMFRGAPSTDVQPGTPTSESVVAPVDNPAVPVQDPVVPAQ